jgi:hypothetical protein
VLLGKRMKTLALAILFTPALALAAAPTFKSPVTAAKAGAMVAIGKATGSTPSASDLASRLTKSSATSRTYFINDGDNNRLNQNVKLGKNNSWTVGRSGKVTIGQ